MCESTEKQKPLNYYNNLASTMVLAKVFLNYSDSNFVLSLSATVYRENKVPFVETKNFLQTTDHYGEKGLWARES